MMTVDEALQCADNMRTTIEAEGFACAEDFALVCLAAEVRRLREQGASDEITIGLIDHRLESFRDENARLREENERLRGWIRVEGGCNNTCTRQILGEVCHGCKCGKTLPEPAP